MSRDMAQQHPLVRAPITPSRCLSGRCHLCLLGGGALGGACGGALAALWPYSWPTRRKIQVTTMGEKVVAAITTVAVVTAFTAFTAATIAAFNTATIHQ